MNTTLPRSPATLRWRLAISSRKGTMTVHPERAVGSRVSEFPCSWSRIPHTEAVHDVSSQKAGSSKNGGSVTWSMVSGGSAMDSKRANTSKRRPAAPVSSQQQLHSPANAPSACHGQDGLSGTCDPDVLVEISAANGGEVGGAHGRGLLGREGGSRARTAERRGHGCDVQWRSEVGESSLTMSMRLSRSGPLPLGEQLLPAARRPPYTGRNYCNLAPSSPP